MVIGNGMIANAFKTYIDDSKYIIFASGVSDSSNLKQSEFDREEKLLNEIINLNRDKVLIYFSTCSIYDEISKSTPYVLHKIKMEKTINSTKINHIIFRVSNPIGFTKNIKTFFNYFVDKINNGEQFELWNNSYRNIIDIEDMYKLCNYIIKENKYVNTTINIANPINYKIQFIINEIEKYFNKLSNSKIIEKGSEPIIDTTISKEVLDILKIKINEGYVAKMLTKYSKEK
jgi:nucleoside-diphosphate-sugar epimerase